MSSKSKALPASPAVSEFMRRQRRRDTRPEVALRRELHRRGLRYRVHDVSLPGTPDVVLSRARVAVFVDGCFWHGCPLHYVSPRSNAAFWSSKIEGNRLRDRRKDEQLIGMGWLVVHVWEHETPADAADRVELAWRERRAQ